MWATKSKRKYAKYRESNRISQAKRYEQKRTWLHEQKDKPCLDCGGRFLPCQLDFDHRDGSVKRFGLSSSLHRTQKEVEEEIAKCDLICANCHRLRTYLRKRYPSIDHVGLLALVGAYGRTVLGGSGIQTPQNVSTEPTRTVQDADGSVVN